MSMVFALAPRAASAVPAYTMRIDATALTSTSFLLVDITPPITTFPAADGTSMRSFVLEEGSYVVQPGSGLVMSCPLSVAPGGSWDYAPDCNGFVSGRGTDTLMILGYPVGVDAAPLSITRFIVANLFGAAPVDADVVQPMRLVPAEGYSFLSGSGLVCACSWDVDRDGRVQYASAYDGFLAGRGTDMIRFAGYTVSIDATALSATHFVPTNLFGVGFLDASVPQPLTVLPDGGGYLVQTGSGSQSIGTFRWNVDPSTGLVTYDPAFDGYLTGRGTTTLRVLGAPVEVDARALGAGRFAVLSVFGVGALDDSVVQPLTLLPTLFYTFLTRTFSFNWSVRDDGTIDYSPSLDRCVSGRGTARLTVRCDPAAVDVRIDVKPGSALNPVNLGSEQIIPVAILTTAGIDASALDASSIRFGPAGAPEAHGRGHAEDVDGDGDVDMMLHFNTTASGVGPSDTQACLLGRTTDGRSIFGCDRVVAVP
jgi:hypothetical protein